MIAALAENPQKRHWTTREATAALSTTRGTLRRFIEQCGIERTQVGTSKVLDREALRHLASAYRLAQERHEAERRVSRPPGIPNGSAGRPARKLAPTRRRHKSVVPPRQ